MLDHEIALGVQRQVPLWLILHAYLGDFFIILLAGLGDRSKNNFARETSGLNPIEITICCKIQLSDLDRI